MMQNKTIWSFTLILVGIIFLLNLIAKDLFVRFDLTENDRYSISDVSKDILSRIDEPITVKIYYSENFPRQLISVKQYVLDMLNEYRAYAGSSLEYEFIVLSGEDQSLVQEALSYGIQPVQANITESDEIKVQRIYLGLVFLYGDRKEVIPFAQKIEQLEYDMTGAIKKLITHTTPKIGWLTGHNEPDLRNNSIAKALAEIRKNYEIVEIDLTREDKIPDDLSVLLMINATGSISSNDLYKLDQYVLRGGKLGLFMNTKTIDMQNQFMPVQENTSNVFSFFKHYGINFGKQLLLDRNCYQVQAMQDFGIFQIPVAVEYPYAPRITRMNEDNPMVNRLNELGFFFVNEISSSGAGEDLTFTSLMTTSPETGYAVPDPRTRMINISASQQLPDYLFNEGSKTVAGFVQGNYSSFFGAERPDSLSYPDDHLSASLTPSTILATGNSTFMDRQFQIPATLNYFLNTIDWLYDEHGLISIRSKIIQPEQLDEMDGGTRKMLKWINILLAPIIITLFGIIRWIIRKRSKTLAGERI